MTVVDAGRAGTPLHSGEMACIAELPPRASDVVAGARVVDTLACAIMLHPTPDLRSAWAITQQYASLRVVEGW